MQVITKSEITPLLSRMKVENNEKRCFRTKRGTVSNVDSNFSVVMRSRDTLYYIEVTDFLGKERAGLFGGVVVKLQVYIL